MMTKLTKDVRSLVIQELGLARQDHGDYFHSAHEGYGVLMEELEEAFEEGGAVKGYSKPILQSIRMEDKPLLINWLELIEKHAALAACEYIQVAAMATKMRESIEKESKDV